MKIRELIKQLEKYEKVYGDIEIFIRSSDTKELSNVQMPIDQYVDDPEEQMLKPDGNSFNAGDVYLEI